MRVLSDAWDYLTTASSWTGDGGMLELMGQQLLLTLTALVVATAVGLPIALWLGHLGRGSLLAINVSNVGRAVPTFALLALLVVADWPGTRELGPYGRAGLATIIALTLFALPPIITNANIAVREVSPAVRQAADGMGMTGAQKFWRVELPLSAGLVLSGIRLALVQVWATATIAALVAGPGLGEVVIDGFRRTNYGKGIAGAIVIALVALVLEGAAALAQRTLDPVPKTTVRKRRRGMSERLPIVAEEADAVGT
ncbi:ABC transporter permease [Nocardioides sp. YIM 152315]|uniref:ABC transporter permease n=1 Tax=Nocardioides sp. YIM 152315 TaxID=3031760 RepID=UPI0023D99243|nr:ABC transporter permease [Nocardioides sp. YIM 152315]MDF1606193.1 ABC transporter permease [Nocardioides sp. YIM 152315]